MKQRITYIDELKGFAILMVVIGHVFYFSFRIVGNDYTSPWSGLIYSFHMPLFAFLSGLFIKPVESLHTLRKILERLGLPLIVVGSMYTLWRGRSLIDFILNDFKYGYWYFLFLLLAYFVITLFEMVIKVINSNNSKSVSFVMMTLIWLCILGGKKLLPTVVYNMLGCSHLVSYMPFVFAGFFITRYGLFDKVFSNRMLFETCSSLCVIAFVIRYYFHHGTALYLMQPCLVYIIVAIFYRLRDKSNIVKDTFQQWGKNSLEIYSLHYFFIHTCCLPVVYKFTMGHNLEFAEIFLAVVLAVAMCTVCVYIGSLIKMSELFGYLCFGNRNKNLI